MMHEEHKGKNIVLAKSTGLGEISMCGCGVISLHLGSISIRLESAALVQVEQMIQNALDSMCELAANERETQRQFVH